MARLIPAPIDGKNINDDWIWDTLDAVRGTTEDGRDNKGAFYFGEPPVVLWEVIWREGSNAMFFRCHADNPSEKDMKPFIDYLKGIFEGENNLDYESFKATIGICGDTVALHFYHEVDDLI